ncbi:hypothetical protein ACQKP0_23555 [Heyndrickxia sp. NPDC080065]|uniref:hypothetical protein n=1 Tax=Heyndrickxia sp. NPDC080065 TaxID=3390568 RepID=UPI003D014DD3
MSLFEELLKWDKDQCRVVGKKFELGSWNKLSEKDRLGMIGELIDLLCQRLKIKDKPKVILTTLDNAFGAFSPSENTIYIDRKTLSKGGILTACYCST